MMKKILLSILIAISIVFSIPAQSDAADLKHPVIGTKVKIGGGHDATYLGIDSKSGKELWKTVIDAPKIAKDGRSTIDTRWYENKGVYTSGKNMFDAVVKGQTVSINKGELTWTPTIDFRYADGKVIQAKATKTQYITNDYINSNYNGNILRTVYDADGYLFNRDLRLIEGVLCEYYYFYSEPPADIYVKMNAKGDTARLSGVSAWDKNLKTIKVDGSGTSKILLKKDLVGVEYPVILEPSATYYTSSWDGYLSAHGYSSTNALRSQASADAVNDSGIQTIVASDVVISGGAYYWIYRAGFYFDTSDLPDDATITDATLSLYSNNGSRYWGVLTNNMSVVIQTGSNTYPSSPMIASDYNQTNYSSDGGSKTVASGTINEYNTFTLNATGISWINKTGTTKLLLRMSGDIDNVDAITDQWDNACSFNSYSYEQGSGYRPKLEITYTASLGTCVSAAATRVLDTSATFNGEITSTGGEDADRRGFVYGTASKAKPSSATAYNATAYTSNWSETGTFSTGTFNNNIATLTKGTTYYYRSFSHNSGGYSYSEDEQTFTTIGDPVATTVAASSVTISTARLNGTVTASGGATSQYRFGYGTTDQGNNIAAYDTVTAYTGSEETGANVYVDIGGLADTTTYYFNVQVNNGYYTDTGTSTSFTTESSVGSPSGFLAIPTATTVVLSWTKGTGASNSIVVFEINGMPTDHTDGTSIYTGTDTTYTHTGLTSGTTYGYRVSGWDGAAAYSASDATVYATTLATTATTATISDLDKPTAMTATPSVSTVENTIPFFQFVNAINTSTSMPKGSVAFFIALVIMLGVCVLLFRLTHSIEAVTFSFLAMCWITNVMAITPLIICIAMTIIGLGYAVLKARGVV